MKKVVIITMLVLVVQLAQSASMKGSKSLTAANAASSTAIPAMTVMAFIEKYKTKPEHVRYCNTIMALRGMAHNHPQLLKNYVRDGDALSTAADDMCAVACELLAIGKDGYYAKIVAKSLEETPLTTPAGCDGTTCRALIDATKKYLKESCMGCLHPHGWTDYCYTSASCKNHGQKACLRIDELVERELVLRKSTVEDKKGHDYWVKEQTAYWQAVKAGLIDINKK